MIFQPPGSILQSNVVFLSGNNLNRMIFYQMDLENKKIAVMDLGSQTFRMVMVNCSENGIRTEGSWLENVRLGEGLSETGVLSGTAMARGLRALDKFTGILSSRRAMCITAAATAALRRARNADDFIETAAGKGVNIRVISGREELKITAEGIFHTLESPSAGETACLSPHDASGSISILDVGGGSTEISFYQNTVLRNWASLDIGAVNLTEKFFPSHGPDETGMEKLSQFIDRELAAAPYFHAVNAGKGLLVGTGGTITTLAAMQLGLVNYEPAKIRRMKLETSDLNLWINRMTTMTMHEKRCISGLEPERADIILAGMVIIHRIMSKAGFSTIVTSDGGLLLGLLIRAIKKECISYAESSSPGGLYV